MSYSVADPGFPLGGGANTPGMKLKEFRPWGEAHVTRAPLDPPLLFTLLDTDSYPNLGTDIHPQNELGWIQVCSVWMCCA